MSVAKDKRTVTAVIREFLIMYGQGGVVCEDEDNEAAE